MVRVAVLGAGVNGLGCAVRIKETMEDVEVVIISEEFSPNTTGDGAAGLWYPYLCGDTPEDKLYKWGKETYHFIHKLWHEGAKGVCAIPIYVLEESEIKKYLNWKDFVFGFNVMDQRQLQYMSDMHSSNYRHGFYFTTFTAQPTSLLPYLMDRFIKAGGSVVRGKIPSLKCDMLKEFDVIVNCMGLSARTLLSDIKTFPIRGQVIRVNAPWAFEVFSLHSGHYIIPNVENCVLGGTSQKDNYNTTVDPEDSRFILQGCKKIMPSLEHAPVVNEWAGLRPARASIRLECETIDDKLYIHNYGHGGSGITLFWGCAGNVLELLRYSLDKKITPMITESKL